MHKIPLALAISEASGHALSWTSSFVEERNTEEEIHGLFNQFVQAKTLSAKIDTLLQAHAWFLSFNRHKLQVVVGQSLSLESNLKDLVTRFELINDKYQKYVEELDALLAKLPAIVDRQQQIDYESVDKIELNYQEYEGRIAVGHTQYLELSRSEQIDQSRLKTRSETATNKSTLQNLLARSESYRSNLTDMGEKTTSIAKLYANIKSIVAVCRKKLDEVELSYENLLKKNADSITTSAAYLDMLARLAVVTTELTARSKALENFIVSFNSQYDEANCFFSRKEEELKLLVNSCKIASSDLKYYYDLFIGSNYIQAGDHIQLNRVGCAVIVNAYLPDLLPCKKPPVLPPMPGDVSVNQDPLPDCPPPMCKSDPTPTTTTTVAPNTITTTTTTTTTTRKPSDQEGDGNCTWLQHIANFAVSLSYDKSGSTLKCDKDAWKTAYDGLKEYPGTQGAVAKGVFTKLNEYLLGNVAIIKATEYSASLTQQMINYTNTYFPRVKDLATYSGLLVIRIDDSEDNQGSSTTQLFKEYKIPIYVLHIRLLDYMDKPNTKETFKKLTSLLNFNIEQKRVTCWKARAYAPESTAFDAVDTIVADVLPLLPY